MALTQLEQLLIDYLTLSNAQEWVQVVAFILLKEEDQMLEMCRFLSVNADATEEEILEMAYRLAGEAEDEEPESEDAEPEETAPTP